MPITEKQYLTNSSSTTFKLCRRRYWYAYEMGLRPLVDAKALRMGSVWHEALEVLKAGLDVDAAISRIRTKYAFAEDTDLEAATLESLVAAYSWRWATPGPKLVASEYTFHTSLPNLETQRTSRNFDLAGKIDGIVELEDGRLAILEHKLLGEDISPSGDLWRRMQMDQQVSLYIYGARQLGFSVSAVLYDVTRKPTIKPTPVPMLDEDGLKIVRDAQGGRVLTARGKPKQTGDATLRHVLQTQPMSAEQWRQKLLDDIQQRPDYYFARIEIARLQSDIDEALQELWEQAKTIRDAQRFQRWYRTVSRNTCPFCSYWGPCSSKRVLDPAECPEGFQYVQNVHPELETNSEQADHTEQAALPR